MNVFGKITKRAHIEIKKGTKFYDNGICIQVRFRNSWWVGADESWCAIKKQFWLKTTLDTFVGWKAYNIKVIKKVA